MLGIEDYMETNERRESVRINKKRAFQFTKLQEGDTSTHSVEGVMLDYSIAGLRFETDEPLEKNTALFVHLDLNILDNDAVNLKSTWETGDAVSLNVIGSVMWCLASENESNIFEVGMRFTQKAIEQ
ncbi:MAG: hypothetical protein ACI8PB_004801 [Desulforhopalus sp.]